MQSVKTFPDNGMSEIGLTEGDTALMQSLNAINMIKIVKIIKLTH